jgi:hypothetical protein
MRAARYRAFQSRAASIRNLSIPAVDNLKLIGLARDLRTRDNMRAI